MGSNHQTMTEAEIATARKQILQTVRQTQLGRGLLAALGKARVKIVFSEDIARAASLCSEEKLRGLYDPRIKTLYVDATMPLHAQLHFFAHEARHALQMQQEQKINTATAAASIYLVSPVTQLYLTRLREIDADVFAVSFVAQNDIHTGSNHFGEMRKRGGFFKAADPYSRAGLYEAFAENWQSQESPRDLAQAARAVLAAFVKDTTLLNTYNNFSLQVWEKTAWSATVDHAQKPRSAYHKDFRALALKKDSAEKPRDIFNARAAAYRKILVRSGAPDYLRGIKPDDLAKQICESNTQADPQYTTNYAYERAIEKFNSAIRHYTAAPANANMSPRQTAKKKAGPKQ